MFVQSVGQSILTVHLKCAGHSAEGWGCSPKPDPAGGDGPQISQQTPVLTSGVTGLIVEAVEELVVGDQRVAWAAWLCSSEAAGEPRVDP